MTAYIIIGFALILTIVLELFVFHHDRRDAQGHWQTRRGYFQEWKPAPPKAKRIQRETE